jgi:hypothetical protein
MPSPTADFENDAAPSGYISYPQVYKGDKDELRGFWRRTFAKRSASMPSPTAALMARIGVIAVTPSHSAEPGTCHLVSAGLQGR